ncbi:MAG TPA: hypothetical protein PK325_02615 [Cyclobacteriaceae bacterium]|nr:hypothetical protein [Cyclobacteriaceae bacterium]HMV07595.1 hypothetical protein [Cyclobacteriaceae bacterium]HMV89325.1 hypothetical protein [Cyclobacteriaceae bacterium]HMW98730.1 hypothetical protein [Cyclobacteriaceae bacterium]HMX48636.1 hypothetical protein [Cyclobacteriaceae bacterium]
MKQRLMVIAAGVLLICYAPHVGAQISADLELVDLSQKEIRIFNQTKKLNAHLANRLMIDSLFLPHEKFWTNYVGGEKDFLKWVRESVYPNLKEMNRVNKRINREAMLTRISKNSTQTKVYVVLGPGCTDIGKFTDGTSVIDLMHKSSLTD